MQPEAFTLVDFIVLALILFGAVQGLFRGLSGEMARVLGAVCAFVGGAILHEPVGEWIAQYTRLENQEARIFTYVVTVILALVLFALFHRIIKKLLQVALGAGFDKCAGIPAGMLRVTALIGTIFIAIHIIQAPFKDRVGKESFFGRQAIRLVPAVQRQLEAHDVNFTRNQLSAANDDDEPEDTEP